MKYTARFKDGLKISVEAENHNLAFGLARKATGKVPVSIEECKGDKFIVTISVILLFIVFSGCLIVAGN